MGEVRRWVREVVVARGWMTKRATKERCGGCGPGVYQSSPRCHVDFDVYYDGDVFLDCSGGDFAIVAWRFRLPANAFKHQQEGGRRGHVLPAGRRRLPRRAPSATHLCGGCRRERLALLGHSRCQDQLLVQGAHLVGAAGDVAPSRQRRSIAGQISGRRFVMGGWPRRRADQRPRPLSEETRLVERSGGIRTLDPPNDG